MASNLITFKGFPTLEMIAKLKQNINTLNLEIETMIVTTLPVAISLRLERKSELSFLLAKEEAKVKQIRKSYGLDILYGHLLDSYKEPPPAPVVAAAGTGSIVDTAAGIGSIVDDADEGSIVVVADAAEGSIVVVTDASGSIVAG